MAVVSNAVVAGSTCHISGQLAVYNDGYRSGSAKEEVTRTFDLVFLIAEESGFTKTDIVYVDIAFSDLNRNLNVVNEVYGSLFKQRPARAVYQADRLPYGAKIKVQAVAMLDE